MKFHSIQQFVKKYFPSHECQNCRYWERQLTGGIGRCILSKLIHPSVWQIESSNLPLTFANFTCEHFEKKEEI